MKKVKFYDYIALAIYLIGGSIITFISANMLFSDISNYASFSYKTIFATFPHFMFVLMIILLGFFFIRYPRLDEKYRINFKKKYFLLFLIFSAIGFVTSILTGFISYNNFLASSPYKGAIIVCLVVHLLILLFSIFAFYKNIKNDSKVVERMPYNSFYVFKTIVFAIFAFISFFRFGCFLTSFIYMEYSKFALTFLFYLSNIIPMILLIFVCSCKLYNISYLTITMFYSITLLLSLTCMIYVISEGTSNPLLVSIISPAMPIERLITFPIEAIILYGLINLLPIGEIVYLSIKEFKK